MKIMFFSIALFMTSSAFALDSNVGQFCQGSANLVPNTFVVSYKADQASVADVTRVLNIVGGLGQTVSLAVDSIGPRFNLLKTNLETELTHQQDYGQFTLKYTALTPTDEQKARVLNFLSAVSQYPGFTVSCKLNLATPQ